jgi:SAM-dependent methyltransferase
MDAFQQANQLNWDDRTALHSTDTTGSYRIADVLKGGSSLHPLEASEIGDVAGKDVIHLQCHIGLDTISLKHLGARSATGLDFSSKAIEAAREFARLAKADVRFVEANLFDAVEALGETYDVVYVTWGAVNWLDDIFRWARIVAALLKPGGRLYLLEGHPQFYQFELRDNRLAVAHDWFTPREKPLSSDEDKTYTGDERTVSHTRYYLWFHPISDIVNALIRAGMTIDFFNEHEILTWKALPDMVAIGNNQFKLAPHHPRVPLAFSVGASKRG